MQPSAGLLWPAWDGYLPSGIFSSGMESALRFWIWTATAWIAFWHRKPPNKRRRRSGSISCRGQYREWFDEIQGGNRVVRLDAGRVMGSQHLWMRFGKSV